MKSDNFNMIYGIKVPFDLNSLLNKDDIYDRYNDVQNKIIREYKLDSTCLTNELSTYTVVGISMPLHTDSFFDEYNVAALNHEVLNDLTETDNFKNAVGCLFELVLDVWKKYELENEKNKEILLPESLEFDWFISD